MNTIDVASYLDHALSLRPEEVAAIRKYSDWLPSEIIDCHAHATLPDHVITVPDSSFRHMHSTFPWFDLEQSKKVNSLLHPGKLIRTLRFAIPWRGIDQRSVNTYLLDQSPSSDRVALFGLSDDVEYTVQALCDIRVKALKMYYAYLNPPATHVYEYFVPEVLEEASKLGVPIILHPPKVVTTSLTQLTELLNDFPRLTVVIAHLGLTKVVVPGLGDAYRILASHENVFMDTSMVPSREVVSLALKAFGENRIMYGSDQPVNLIRAVAYEHPVRGQRLLTDYPYHWVDKEEHREYRHLVKGVVHTHWQQLEAIKSAVERLPAKKRNAAKAAIFKNNASSVYCF